MSSEWRVGTRVIRELEGIDFPACVTVSHGHGLYDIVYTDDGNVEEEIHGDELRLDENAGGENTVVASEQALKKNWMQPAGTPPRKTGQRGVLADFGDNLNALKVPRVIIHQIEHKNSPVRNVNEAGAAPGSEGRSRAARPSTSRSHKQAAASAFIINGPETNYAAGRGLRGIRWLRNNPNSY